LWVVDLTYVPLVPGGFGYVAFVIDAFSRMIARWKAARHIRTSLALDALEMAISARLRAGQSVAGAIHHSDRGSPTWRSATPAGSPKPGRSPP
jgi:putative transposase